MARVLITCTGLFSNLFSSIALAHELRDGGFDVVFAAPAPCLAAIATSGFEAHEITAPKLGVTMRYLPKPGLFDRFKSRAKRAHLAAREIRKDGFEQVLHAVHPDIVLPDCEHHSTIIQSAAAQYQVLLLCFMYFVPPSDTAPPVTSGIVPEHGESSAKSIKRAWAKLQAQKQRKLRVSALKGWGADMPTAHKALAESVGFDLAKYTTTQAFQTPWSYLFPTVFLVPQALDFTGELAPDQYFIGPKVLGMCRDETPDPEMARYFEAPAGTKRIYVSFGSIRTPSASFITTLMAVARANQDWEFLVASRAVGPSDGNAIPPNVTVVAWAPQYAALQIADCAIFHGGAGTFNDCTVTATPMLIYPDALDGKGNGARAVFHNVGKVGCRSDTAATLKEHIESLLFDPEIKNRINKMKSDSLSSHGSKKVTKLVTEMTK